MTGRGRSNRAKPLASLSLDLDNAWSYLKTHGDERWRDFPSYLDAVVPRFLNILSDLPAKITVFVVGQDAVLDKNAVALQAIVQAGHEIGNHSFHHEPWLHLYSEEKLEAEIERAEQAILAATGYMPSGFRGPGYSSSDTLFEILAKRGYRFDASYFPTFLGPLARAYYFLTSHLSAEEKEQRQRLFGSWRDGLKPLKAFKLRSGRNDLWEIPVTTVPIVRVPFHMSYLLYIATFSPAAAVLYFKAALGMCRAFGLSPSLLLHPLDFACPGDAPGLEFFPAMNLPLDRKLSLVQRLLSLYTQRFEVLPMGRYCATLEEVAPKQAALSME